MCGVPTAGSPYAAKVYDVQAIKVKESSTGVVGKAVTFLGKMFFYLSVKFRGNSGFACIQCGF